MDWLEKFQNPVWIVGTFVTLLLLGYCARKVGLIRQFKDPADKHLYDWWDYHVNRFVEWMRNPSFKDYDITKGFVAEKVFTTTTPTGFKVRYGFQLICRRLNEDESKREHMLDKRKQEEFVTAYNEEVLLPYLRERSCFFHLEWRKAIELDKQYEVFRTPVCQLVVEDGRLDICEFPDTKIMNELRSTPLVMNGCDGVMGEFNRNIFDDDLVEDNYAMLTEEQRKAVVNDPRYGAFEEMLAVSALNRRLELRGKLANQFHESEWFSVQTEKAGMTVKIAWKMKEKVPAGFELVGFRKTGGFHPNAHDEENNGTLVIHSFQDGETIEPLDEGEANFYTLYLRAINRNRDGTRRVYNALRFQIIVSALETTEKLRELLKRIEQRRPSVDQNAESLVLALKELRSYFELDNAFDAMKDSFSEQIRGGNYSRSEKAEKIGRLNDIVNLIRNKYQDRVGN